MKNKGEVPMELLETLNDFTSKENWDKFFSLRGSGDSFEWYAEWPSIKGLLLGELSALTSAATEGNGKPKSPQVLVPGCGSSRLSEHIYDAGFHQITNIDFSKVVISDMLRRNVRSRPEMRWRVMDMTDMQFREESFDVVLDKGALDALMEPNIGLELGNKYLNQVKRVIKSGGKYLCLTLGESHVLGLLFSLFRFGWRTSVHSVPQKPDNKSTFQTFMLVFIKEHVGMMSLIESSFFQSTKPRDTEQAQSLVNAIKSENQIREEYYSNFDSIHSLKDLELGAQGNIQELKAGRRCRVILGGHGESHYSYRAILLDAHHKVGSFTYTYGVFIVPKIRAHEWLFASEEGQWQIVETSKAARLVMVFLDSSHSHVKIEAIQKDLSPLVKSLAPTKDDSEYEIPFMMASDGIAQRKIVHQATSKTTGLIIVEDVIYDNADGKSPDNRSSENMIFSSPYFREKLRAGYQNSIKIDHGSLASSYHSGIISGFSLVATALGNAVSLQGKVNVTVVGLGAGLFPMFLHQSLPFLDIEVIELDPVVVVVARDYFGFKEDQRLKVHIGDGIKFIRSKVAESSSKAIAYHEKNSSTDTESKYSIAHGENGNLVKILIVDADCSDLSHGLACPPPDFVEESFLTSVNDFLSGDGLFIINLVSRSPAIKQMVISRLEAAFGHLFSMELEEDVNEVLFASSMESSFEEGHLAEAVDQLQKLSKFPLPKIEMQAKQLRRLK
ncbi:hypothetical protein HPP92_024237 [Vanilla planifolia]|uniref:Methyltransferase type 11 domain-containing protein n=1 Tax=Vanilla planifolia TaxID=51239 RepID=A0A835PRM2_VANPL|nr:hypothetical protein HPP92_024237 [Vanilla planifolia]